VGQLRVRANPRAIQALTEFYQPALVSGGLTVEAVDPLDPKPVDQVAPLKNLGLRTDLSECLVPGFSLKFDLAQLGATEI